MDHVLPHRWRHLLSYGYSCQEDWFNEISLVVGHCGEVLAKAHLILQRHPFPWSAPASRRALVSCFKPSLKTIACLKLFLSGWLMSCEFTCCGSMWTGPGKSHLNVHRHRFHSKGSRSRGAWGLWAFIFEMLLALGTFVSENCWRITVRYLWQHWNGILHDKKRASS